MDGQTCLPALRSAACALLLSLAAWSAPPDTAGIGFNQKPGAAVPMALVLTDSTGRAAPLAAFTAGRPAVLLLGYFNCPSLCGLVRDDVFTALAQSGLQPGEDYTLLDLSIDPKERPADAAAAKAADMGQVAVPGAAANWHYLTGDTAPVAAAVGFNSRWDAGLGQFLHPAGLVVLSPAGTVSSYLPGIGYTGAALRGAVGRAAAGTVMPAASPVLLLCFHYDATTGRYDLAIEKVLRLFAAATLVAIGGLLLVLHRRRRIVRQRGTG